MRSNVTLVLALLVAVGVGALLATAAAGPTHVAGAAGGQTYIANSEGRLYVWTIEHGMATRLRYYTPGHDRLEETVLDLKPRSDAPDAGK